MIDQFEYLLTDGGIDIYGYGCLRVGIDHKTGKQVMGYIVNTSHSPEPSWHHRKNVLGTK
jgi:hypothetical protein